MTLSEFHPEKFLRNALSVTEDTNWSLFLCPGLSKCIKINNTLLAIYKQEKTKTHDVEWSFWCHSLSKCNTLCYWPAWTEQQQIGTRAGPRKAFCVFQEQASDSAGLQTTWMEILRYWHMADICPTPLWKVAQWGRSMCAPHPPRQQLYSPCASGFHGSITVKASEHWHTSEPQSPPSSSKGTWKSSMKGSAPSLPRASDFRRPRPGYRQDPTVEQAWAAFRLVLLLPPSCLYLQIQSPIVPLREYWRGLPFPSPGDLPDPGIKPGSPALLADPLPSETPGKPRPLLIIYN